MTKSRSIIFGCLVSALLLSGCSSNDADDFIVVTELEGLWVSQCREYSINTFSGSAIWVDDYYGNSLITTIEIYDSIDCFDQPVLIKDMFGTFEIGSSFTSGVGLIVDRLDIEIDSVDVTGFISGVNPGEVELNAGSAFYDLFYYADGNLFYGDTSGGIGFGSGQSPADRPSDIFFGRAFTLE